MLELAAFGKEASHDLHSGLHTECTDPYLVTWGVSRQGQRPLCLTWGVPAPAGMWACSYAHHAKAGVCNKRAPEGHHIHAAHAIVLSLSNLSCRPSVAWPEATPMSVCLLQHTAPS